MKKIMIILPVLLLTSMTVFAKLGLIVTNNTADTATRIGCPIVVKVDKAFDTNVRLEPGKNSFIETSEGGERAITWEESYEGQKEPSIYKTKAFKSPSELFIYHDGKYKMKETMKEHPEEYATIVKLGKFGLPIAEIKKQLGPDKLSSIGEMLLSKVYMDLCDKEKLSKFERALIQDMIAQYFGLKLFK
jgi:hypothetical protein